MRFILLAFLFIQGFFVQAQEISNSMWRFSFENPKEWRFQNNGDVVLLGHDTVAGLILVYPNRFSTQQELENTMKQGLNEVDGYLQLQGKLHKYQDNGYRGDYTGMFQMQVVKAKAYGRLIPKAGGAIVIVMTTPESFSDKLNEAGKSIITSLKAKAQKTTHSSENITQRFVGKWSYYSKYTENHIYLYPDGTYSDSSSSNYGNSNTSAGATWGMANDSNARGHWQAQGDANKGQIIFTSANGKKSAYPYKVHILNGQTVWSEYNFGKRLYSRKPLN